MLILLTERECKSWILGTHGGDNKEYGPMGCNTVIRPEPNVS
jgi:hypothetical protein